MKTIDILGQVLRNGAGSIDAAEKREIVDEIYRLARRVNGSVLKDLPNQLTGFAMALSRHFEVKYPNDTPDMRINRIVGHITHLFWLVTFRSSAASRIRWPTKCSGGHSTRFWQPMVASLTGCSIYPSSWTLPRVFPQTKLRHFTTTWLATSLFGPSSVALIINHLYLYSVPENERQAICEKARYRDRRALAVARPGPKKGKRLTGRPPQSDG